MTGRPIRDDAQAPVGVGLLGLGVVGSAVAQAIQRRSCDSPHGSSPPLDLRGVLVRDTSRQRSVEVPAGVISTDPASILENDRISIIVEVMGGETPAFEYISAALRAGKHVVTANKEVLCKRGDELISLAAENNVRLYYEASVGGGIPILGTLSDDLLANKILSLRAIINGTTNYILTRMAREGTSFEDALSEAQALGYAEADPTSDLDGFDALYKISILTRLAFHSSAPVDAIYREGIRNIHAKDFRYAQELGYTIKLLAVAQRADGGLLLRVHPALVPLDVPMAGVNGALNVVEVEGDLVGPLWLQGRGAGAEPTASAVMGDLLRIARELHGSGAPVRYDGPGLHLLPMDEHECMYYLRVTAVDRAGVLAKIASVLGEAGISIRSVLQMDTDDERGVADLVIMTHSAREVNMQSAADRLRNLDVVAALDNLVRVETYSDVD
ncbi:MAG: homoserine dehydrogenase [Dehalococcoidia bacterium]